MPPSAARYGELLVGVLDALGLERVLLLGNSIGGAASLRAGLRRAPGAYGGSWSAILAGW
ncbi:MAG: hypothetical protein U0802_16310 [Candidatus Binatia bacterium]